MIFFVVIKCSYYLYYLNKFLWKNSQTNNYASIVNQQLLDFNLNEIGSTCLSKSLSIDSNDAYLEGLFLFQVDRSLYTSSSVLELNSWPKLNRVLIWFGSV